MSKIKLKIIGILKAITAVVLSVALVMGAIPGAGFVETAHAAGTGKKLQLGASALADNAGASGAATVYYGKNDRTWRVIGYETTGVASTNGKLALLAGSAMGSPTIFNEYSPGQDCNNYDGSKLQVAMNALFSNTYFSSKEKDVIAPRNLAVDEYTNEEPYSDGVSETEVASQSLWPLSTKEAYTLRDNCNGSEITNIGNYWWLRSPGYKNDFAAIINWDGLDVDYDGYTVYTSWYVRPAFNLNLSSIILTSDAEGGKDPGTRGAGTLNEVAAYTGTAWKLTILDSDRNSFTASAGTGATVSQLEGYTSWTVPITYSGATTGENEYVSIILTDSSGSALYYGHIAENREGGTVNVTIPTGLTEGTYTLKVFSEQCNGNKKTDYASDLKSIDITVGTEHTITCSTDGHGSATATPASGTAGTTVEIKATPDSGYRFKEWQVQSGNITLADARSSTTTFSMGNCDVRIKAIFEEITGDSRYTVTFDSNGHGKAPASQTVESGAKATEPEDPEEEGYIFRGWYKEAECENRYNFNTQVTGDITLYAKWRKDESEDDDHDDSPANTVNPALLSCYYEQAPYKTTVIKQTQGNLARLAFNAGMPAGYKEAFTYNMLVNGKADHSLKSGKFVLTIPAEYQKAGRKFALLGLDRTGKVLCFTDTDLSDSTLTTTLLIDGYAFMFVYSDGSVSTVKTTSVTAGNTAKSSGTYKVKKGDTLSGIAKKLDTTVAKLMRNNNIKEKDKIREGQILKY